MLNISHPKGNSDVYVESFGFSLLNGHCLRREGVLFLNCVMEKRKELRIQRIVWVFKLLLQQL